MWSCFSKFYSKMCGFKLESKDWDNMKTSTAAHEFMFYEAGWKAAMNATFLSRRGVPKKGV